MRFLLPLLLILLSPSQGLAAPDGGVADGGAPDAAPLVAPASVASLPSAPVIVSAAAPVVEPESLIPTSDELKQGQAAVESVRALAQAPSVVAACGALALVLNLFIGYLRKRGRLARRKSVKTFIVLASALSGGLAMVVPGMHWVMAVIVALGPFLAMVLHEYGSGEKPA